MKNYFLHYLRFSSWEDNSLIWELFSVLFLTVFFFSFSVLWIFFFFQYTQWSFSISAASLRDERLCMCACSVGSSSARTRLTLCPPCCSVSARGQAVVCRKPSTPWVTASFLLWSPWERESVFPSKLSGALHHIKHRCHDSASSSTGNLTIAELTAYKAVCRSFNRLWFATWPTWLVFEVSKMAYVCFLLNS